MARSSQVAIWSIESRFDSDAIILAPSELLSRTRRMIVLSVWRILYRKTTRILPYFDPLNDDEVLIRLGRRPLLNRSFGFMSILGLSCSALCSWEGILVTSVPSFTTGGPAVVIWTFVVGWIGITSVYTVMAELSSIAPTAGGQYHWVAMMAPESCSNFLTYLTAWLTTLAWQAIAITTSYLITTTLQGVVVLARPSYIPLPWHTLLIMWASILFAVLINSTTGRFLARLEGVILILHLVGFFGILVPLVYFSPHNDASVVFTDFFDNGGWGSQGLTFFVGLPSIASTLIGADCAVHMSEEIQSAATVVPQALVYTIFINGSLAFAMTIALMFCITDIDAAMAAAETMFYPFLEVFQSGVNSTTGAVIMSSVVLILAAASTVGVYASASRMIWSFSRDNGLPFSRHLAKRSSLPIYAIFSTMGISSLISLIVLGPAVALSALLSLVVAALYSSYMIVCGLFLWRRCTGSFRKAEDACDPAEGLVWGPWKLPEPLGILNNVFACLYSAVVLFWSFWPQTTAPTPETFNWSILIFGAVVLFSIVWYMIRARHHFRGPIKEI
ncbi:putative GABA transporter [Annulohypoxylon maeteangense]|uniref:putative GABA transporter n=1 Tax=Annulohypoxylon maeteangense TaxID=1927788 RepID=UPI0020072A86|nr:putative GABA transporter [Annulohypoxylon maeteangense]KAI0881260.1 putative GABA transporter [Annulohypoxylon maeteangense]